MKTPRLALALLALLVVPFAGCTSNQTRGATQGATRGAVAGAAAGAVGALIFGGNVGESAAQGAVWAGTAGAVGGAMAGSDADRREAEQQRAAAEQELRKLRKRIGEDAFNGLSALADCKHGVALAYADTAEQSDNPKHALAAIWLRALTYLDAGRDDDARVVYGQLAEKDDRVSTADEAEADAVRVLETVRDYREKEGRPRTCS